LGLFLAFRHGYADDFDGVPGRRGAEPLEGWNDISRGCDGDPASPNAEILGIKQF
jgi:hypothetical protein